MQEDTYYGDGLNLYEYCRNNPVFYRDPSGHAVVLICPQMQNLYGNSNGKQQTPDQKALLDLAREAEKLAKRGNPISYDDAKILDSWAKEYNVPQHHPATPGSGAHFPGGNYADHTHIYNIHVPYN